MRSCSFNTLVKPYHYIDEFITLHTGITNEMLSEAPKIQDIIQKFKDFIGNDIIIAHNAHFDINFLYADYTYYLSVPCINNFIDTLRLARRVFKDFENHKLTTLATKFNIEQTTAHRSIPDCLTVFACYQYLKKYIIENNIDLSPNKYKSTIVKAKDLSTNNITFNEEHPLFNKTCAFTGALEKLQRKDAMQLVLDCGGKIGDGVTKETEFLILGNLSYCSTIQDGKSAKQKKAEKLLLKGQDITIISENTFYEMLFDNENQEE